MKKEEFEVISLVPSETLKRDLDISFSTKSGDKLSCKCCSAEFIRGDWCFYQLCNDCFYLFNHQKMNARFGMLSGKARGTGTEDVNKWIEDRNKDKN